MYFLFTRNQFPWDAISSESQMFRNRKFKELLFQIKDLHRDADRKCIEIIPYVVDFTNGIVLSTPILRGNQPSIIETILRVKKYVF